MLATCWLRGGLAWDRESSALIHREKTSRPQSPATSAGSLRPAFRCGQTPPIPNNRHEMATASPFDLRGVMPAWIQCDSRL